MPALPPANSDQRGDKIEVRLTVLQMMVAIAVIGVILALLVQIPILVVGVLDAILLGFGLYKVGRAPAPVWLILLIAIAFVGWGCCMVFWLLVARF
jgi:hypothetical protein